jgi:hypothetical protein
MNGLLRNTMSSLIAHAVSSGSRLGQARRRSMPRRRGGKLGERRLRMEPLESRQLFSVSPTMTSPPAYDGEAVLTGTCSPDGYEADNNYSRAKEIATDGTAQVHSLHTGTDVDWVMFSLDSYSEVVIGTAGRSGDTRLWLYASDRSGTPTLIAQDDDGGLGAFSSIRKGLDCGWYYAKVGEKGQDHAIAKYTISVTATIANPPSDPYENDNDRAHAKQISPDGKPQTHSLHTPQDRDWISITLNQRSDVQFTFDTRGDLLALLLDTKGNVIDYDSASGYSSPDVSNHVLDPGTYYVEVSAMQATSTVGSYSLSVTATTAGPNATYMLVDHWGGQWWDAEKSPTNTEDDNLCWAAATSNVLAWTGWGCVKGMTTADQVFRYFQNHWTDEGGTLRQGYAWWFTGSNPGQGKSGLAQVDVPGGGFFPGESLKDHVHVTTTSQQVAGAIDSYLRSGCGVELAIYTLGGGHAITCWGMDYDSLTGKLRGIYVTDSDDDKGNTNAPDTLRRYDVVYEDGMWWMPHYFGGYVIDSVIAVDRRNANAPVAAAIATSATPSIAIDLVVNGVRRETTHDVGIEQEPKTDRTSAIDPRALKERRLQAILCEAAFSGMSEKRQSDLCTDRRRPDGTKSCKTPGREKIIDLVVARELSWHEALFMRKDGLP